MSALRNTVVGVDGSAGSELALAWAAAQADGGEITAVHAFPPLPSVLVAFVLVNLDSLRAEHKRMLEEEWTADVNGSNATVDPVLVDDNPAAGLRAVAQRKGNLPIVIGFQEPGRWSRHHVGDVANRLLHYADVPVVMMTEEANAKPLAGTIVVGVHGLVTASHEPIVWATQIAAERSLAIHVVSINQPPTLTPGYGYPANLYEADINAVHEANVDTTEALAASLRAENRAVSVTCETLEGHPTTMLSQAINELNPTLVVIGNYHHTKLASIATDSVARHLPTMVDCPVAAIPAE
jgi:nucleotide-binding universal stress UspA family protein